MTFARYLMILFGVVILLALAGVGPGNAPPSSTPAPVRSCSTSDLGYPEMINAQIRELCAFGRLWLLRSSRPGRTSMRCIETPS